MLPLHIAKVYIATGTIDMRKSINGLSLLVVDQMELDPLSEHLFAFCNRKRYIVKVLYWHRNGRIEPANPIFAFSDTFVLSKSPKSASSMQPIGRAVTIVKKKRLNLKDQ